MGKSDEKPTKKRAHKATDGESKHKNKPSFDATTFEATDDGGVRHTQWCDHFRLLSEYKLQFGDCLVPKEYSGNPKLGRWVSHQRSNYRLYQEGKPSPITEERIRALESAGFHWGASKTDLASVWGERLQQLREFKVQFGHCLVPFRYSANPTLGKWVSRQRNKYGLYQEGKPSPMTAERIRALESVGFDWETRKTDLASIWEERFQQLREFKVQFGHCLVPFRYSANPKLRKWVSHQRHCYRLYQEGKISPMTDILVTTGGQASLIWHPFGANAFNNCVNSRSNSAAAACHIGTLPTPSSGGGFRVSANPTS